MARRRVPTQFKIDPEVKAQAQAICREQGISLASVVEAALRRYVARHRTTTSEGAQAS